MVLPLVQLKATRVSTTTCGEICHPEIKPNLPDTNVFDEKLSVRDTEKLVKELKKPKKEKEKPVRQISFIL